MQPRLLGMATVSCVFHRNLLPLTPPIVQKNFVKTIRAVELLLGIPVPGESLGFKPTGTNFTDVLNTAASSSGSGIFTSEIKSVLKDAVPILAGIGFELAIPAIFNFQLPSAPVHSQRAPLVAK